MYPILIIVLVLIFYFCRFNFHVSLQKSVRMQPSLLLLTFPRYFTTSCLLAWRLLTLSFLVPKTVDLDSLRFPHHFHRFKNFLDIPNYALD